MSDRLPTPAGTLAELLKRGKDLSPADAGRAAGRLLASARDVSAATTAMLAALSPRDRDALDRFIRSQDG